MYDTMHTCVYEHDARSLGMSNMIPFLFKFRCQSRYEKEKVNTQFQRNSTEYRFYFPCLAIVRACGRGNKYDNLPYGVVGLRTLYHAAQHRQSETIVGDQARLFMWLAHTVRSISTRDATNYYRTQCKTKTKFWGRACSIVFLILGVLSVQSYSYLRFAFSFSDMM
jgi:hypothetical protein